MPTKGNSLGFDLQQFLWKASFKELKTGMLSNDKTGNVTNANVWIHDQNPPDISMPDGGEYLSQTTPFPAKGLVSQSKNVKKNVEVS